RTSSTRQTCRKTCASRFIWCLDRKWVCRHITNYRWKSVWKSVRKTRETRRCKTGWLQDGSECTT
ncbi:Hypothetical predicted protein, partial [Paramuricea clavata]